jgi:hypothetical protein
VPNVFIPCSGFCRLAPLYAPSEVTEYIFA